MLKSFPIPVGADAKSTKLIKAAQDKLGNLYISEAEIKRVIDGIMRQQEPRDRERAEKKAERARARAEQRARAAQNRRRYPYA